MTALLEGGGSLFDYFSKEADKRFRGNISDISNNQKKNRVPRRQPTVITINTALGITPASVHSAREAGLVHTPRASCTQALCTGLRSRAHASGLMHTPQTSCTRLRSRAHASDGSTVLPRGYEENSMR